MNKANKILKKVNEENLIIRLLFFFVAVFIVALNYNLVLVKNSLVIGGISGLAIVIKELTGLSTTIFLYSSTVILTLVSIIFLDKVLTLKTLFGALTFNLMVSLSGMLTKYITINFESSFILLLFTSVVYGISYGLIYRAGFNTGGSDTISAIISKYTKMPMGSSAAWTNIFIIFSGFIVFGLTKTIYAVFVLLVSNKIADMIILGVKDSKMCYIKSSKTDEILKYLLNQVNIGVTKLEDSKSGAHTPVLLVIVPLDQYYGLKHIIKKIDSKAFLVTNNCHDVSGGYKKALFPY